MISSLHGEECLFPGQRIISPRCSYYLEMQTDGNLVLYTRRRQALWDAGTDGSGATHVIMQNDGNMVVRSGWNTIWAAFGGESRWPWAHDPVPTQQLGGWAGTFRLQMQDDGNAVIYGGRDPKRAWWASNTQVTGPVLGRYPCGLPSAKTRILLGTDFPGGDYQAFYLTDPTGRSSYAACARACTADPHCTDFTWVRAGVQHPRYPVCWKKHRWQGRSVQAAHCVSGQILRS